MEKGSTSPLVISPHPPLPSLIFLPAALSLFQLPSFYFLSSFLPSSSFTSLVPLPSSSSSPPSQEGCEIVLCHIKETGALQSEKYDIIRIIPGNLWIQHRFWISVNQIFCEIFGRNGAFLVLSSLSLCFSLTQSINLSVSSLFSTESVFILFRSSPHPLFPPLSCSASLHQRKTSLKREL